VKQEDGSAEHASSPVLRLVQRYVDAATKHGRAVNVGDSKTANRQNARLTRASRALRESGGEGRIALLRLMEHPDPWVRLSAAYDCLAFDERRSIQVLEEIARMPGFVGFTAETVLRERTKRANHGSSGLR